jgi:hypothetical protein
MREGVPLRKFLRRIVISMGVLAAILVFLIGVLSWALSPSKTLIATVPSPDGRIAATLTETNGGATTSFGYIVSLKMLSQYRSIQVANIYGSIRNDRGWGAELAWTDNNTLEIRHRSGDVFFYRRGVAIGGQLVTVCLVRPAEVVRSSEPDGDVRFRSGPVEQGDYAFAAPAGPVISGDKALAVARPILNKIYGNVVIQSEEPLAACRTGDVWTVAGTLGCEHVWWQKLMGIPTTCVGGTAELKLAANTGAILSVTRYK